MFNILLFIISLCFVIFSTYFFTALLRSKRPENSLIFFILNFSAQIIISFEFLSLLKSIDLFNFLKVNAVFFVAGLILWNIKNRPALITKSFDINLNLIKTELKKDKILYVFSFFFLFSVATSLFLALYAPVNLWDSATYHFARMALWLQNKNIGHFETSSVRQIMFPPNAELLYLPVLLFFKKDFMAGIVQFSSFCGSLWVLSSFLSYLKISKRRILWAVFVFSSLPAIILQSSSTQNDLVLGFFLFASLYLFIYGIKEKEKISVVFSAMALGIAIGVKSSVFMCLPAIAVVYVIVAFQAERKQFYKPLLFYAACVILFFALLSSYNFILNFYDFHNPLGLSSYINFYTAHAGGVKSFVANFIRYNLSFIDFTGFSFASIFSLPFLFLKVLLFGLFRISESQGLTYTDIILLNTKIHENCATFGPVGFLLFLPLVYRYGTVGVFSKTSKLQIISLTGLIAVLFLLMISMLYGFALWNIRYFVTAVILASPVFALSYTPKLKFMKITAFVFAAACFINISLFNSLRPVFQVNGISLLTSHREDIRYNSGSYADNDFRLSIKYLIRNAKDNSKIGVIFSDKMWYYQFFNQNPSWQVFPLRYELLTEDKLKELDYIVICNNQQLVFNLDGSKNFLRRNKINFNIFKGFKVVDKVKSGFSYKNAVNVKYESEMPEIFYVLKNNVNKSAKI